MGPLEVFNDLAKPAGGANTDRPLVGERQVSYGGIDGLLVAWVQPHDYIVARRHDKALVRAPWGGDASPAEIVVCVGE